MARKRAFGAHSERNGSRRLRIGCLLASTALMIPSTVHSAGLFEDLADPASGQFWTEANGISGNGRYIVGIGESGFVEHGFFYDMTNGVMRDMGQYIAGNDTAPADVSNNGVAVGLAIDAAGQAQAFRWTVLDGYELLGTLDGVNTTGKARAYAISDDGSRIVGQSARQDSIDVGRAFVWIEGATSGVAGNEQMHELAGFAPDARSWALDISANGLFAVGMSTSAGGDDDIGHATRWDIRDITVAGTAVAEDLGTLGGAQSRATGVSGDGRVVVGWSHVEDPQTISGFRWVEGGTNGVAGNPQMQDLGSLGGRITQASGVSLDGSVVVGVSNNALGAANAFRWTEATGMISVADWLAQSGVDVGSVVLINASNVSNDGTTVVGRMENSDDPDNYSPYIARVSGPGPGQGGNPAPVAGLMNVNEYNATAYDTGYAGWTGGNAFKVPLNGAHHRPLMDFPTQPNGICGWANGDLAHYDDDRNTGVALAEAGLCGDMADGTVRIGLGGGLMHSGQDLLNGGSADLDGQYVVGELDWRPDGLPVIFSLTGLHGGSNAEIRRAYSNGASMAFSDGETDIHSSTLRIRADWKDAFGLGSTGFSPYLSYTWGRMAVDAYTETGGSFPAVFDEQVAHSREVRLGLASHTELTSSLALHGSMELVHGSGDAARASGQVIGLYGFTFGGGSYSETWVRAGADLDVKITDSALLSLSMHAATEGLDAEVSGAARLQVLF